MEEARDTVGYLGTYSRDNITQICFQRILCGLVFYTLCLGMKGIQQPLKETS
jgi:hypothetical protein